jgi:hypothetical protein
MTETANHFVDEKQVKLLLSFFRDSLAGALKEKDPAEKDAILQKMLLLLQNYISN